MKGNIWYNALEWKVTVFSTIYFQLHLILFLFFVYVQNNHGCLSVMQSLQYKILRKAVSQLDRKKKTKQWLESTIIYVRDEITQGTNK